MNSEEIREKFVSFFKQRGHAFIPSASLVPENDPSVLFTTAGMQPLVPYLLGSPHPLGKRLVNIQKCVRTGDIDEIGDNTHLTFFEMMGNWSLGDYFKKDAITWSFELLTSKDGFNLDPRRLYVTVFEGDENAPRDEESYAIWKGLFEAHGVQGERIYFLGAKSNWWSAGENGPCGPDTEMFYDVTGTLTSGMTKEEYLQADEKQQVVEIWNDVFMEYEKRDGIVVGKLVNKNVDTGSGLERVTAVLQGKKSIFETDLFKPILDVIPEGDVRVRRIIADHIRAAVFLISDGVRPSNTDQGYVLRRLIRRAVRHIDGVGGSLPKIIEAVVLKYGTLYGNIKDQELHIKNEVYTEEKKFRKTLDLGLKKLKELATYSIDDAINERKLSGLDLFTLYSTYGFPIEVSLEELDRLDADSGRPAISDDIKQSIISEFNAEMEKHQQLSKVGAEQKFKGGLADSNETTVKLHTAHHLLLRALQLILGDGVKQRGSNITQERLRLDFSFDRKVTPEELEKVEMIVNEKIKEALPVIRREMPLEEAIKIGAEMEFGTRYPDKVSVYFIEDDTGQVFSKEFCGGPHVENTRDIGKFEILKEESVAAGIRRIKATVKS